jgi:hypothetical protein
MIRLFKILPIAIFISALGFPSAEALPNTVLVRGVFDCGTSGTFTVERSVVVSGNRCKGELTIPDGVTTINRYVFSNYRVSLESDRRYITKVTLPNSLVSIGEKAFYFQHLTQLTIPKSVTSISRDAFQLNMLTSVTFLGDAPTITSSVSDTGPYYSGMFGQNDNLDFVDVTFGTSGWGDEFSSVDVRINYPNVKATATTKPTVTGTAKVSKTLAAEKGTWSGYPTPTVSYQWYACSGSISTPRSAVPTSCKKITGATKSTFKIASAQKGKFISVLVTGVSAGTSKTTWLSKSTAKVK